MDFTYLLQMKPTQIVNFYIFMDNGLIKIICTICLYLMCGTITVCMYNTQG